MSRGRDSERSSSGREHALELGDRAPTALRNSDAICDNRARGAYVPCGGPLDRERERIHSVTNAGAITVSNAMMPRKLPDTSHSTQRRDVGSGERGCGSSSTRAVRAGVAQRSTRRRDTTVHHARSLNEAFWHASNFSYEALMVDSALSGESLLSLLER